MQRRTFMSSLATAAAAVAASPIAAKETKAMTQSADPADWDKTFPKNPNVVHRKVTFKSRFGITLAADLYKPVRAKGKLAAIAVSGPFGAVKEQASGLYAQRLAQAGFLTIAFDPSFTGESSGFPRHVASPDISTEDFSAAVDFLSLLAEVDAGRIGILGICGFGGFALNAAAADPRIRATVASTMYDMSRVSTYGYNDAMDDAARKAAKKALAAERTRDASAGTYAPAPGLPVTLKGDEPQFVREYWDYYRTPRGFHLRSINSNGAWNATSFISFMNTPLLTFIGDIEAPVLIVHGEKAHSRYFGEDAFKRLKGSNKELYIVPGANHTDLYDTDRIPFAKITQFFEKALL